MTNKTGENASQSKLKVVFRKQNSTTIKELPKHLKSAADRSEKRGRGASEDTPNISERKRRPLPAGTKPVRPMAMGAGRSVSEVGSKDTAASRAASASGVEAGAISAASAPTGAAAGVRVTENIGAAAPITKESAENERLSALAAESALLQSAEQKPETLESKSLGDTAAVSQTASGEIAKESSEPKASPAETGIDEPKASPAETGIKSETGPEASAGVSSAATKSGAHAASPEAAHSGSKSTPEPLSGTELPKVKIVKSYANYDANAVIKEAQRKSRAQAGAGSGYGRAGAQSGTGTSGRTHRDRSIRSDDSGSARFDRSAFSSQAGTAFRGRISGTPSRTQSQGGAPARGEGTSSRGQGGAFPRSQGGTASRGQSQGGAPRGQGTGARGQAQGARGQSQGRNASQRARSARDNRKKDKYRDDILAQQTAGRKGAFIKPEPKQERPEDEIKVIIVPESLSIKELAEKLRLQPGVIVKKLFLEGQMVTPNTEISYEEAENIAMDYDILCEKEVEVDVIAEILKEDEEDTSRQLPRNPVVCVMGHVDHGKTSLLDAIRNTNVTSHEAGGITQHIGASVVGVGDRNITFLDTPGHEAFTAMRLRGAQSTDIAVLVVAADDGVKPQTVEAINHAKAANVEVVVAINKMDKEGANPDMVRNELAEYGLISESWGGSTPMVEVSARTGDGIADLLDMILLEADVLELKADPERLARGLVIEAELDKGRGPVATVLVQKGTLRVGDNIVAGSSFGKVRAMFDDKHTQTKFALPSYPAEILGLNDVPEAGEVFMVVKDEKEARAIAETFVAEHKKHMLDETRKKMNLDDLFEEIRAGNVKELPLIIKADVQGSVEAVKQSLGKLGNDEVSVNVIHAAVGNINESDVSLASASNAIIIGFNVKPDALAKSAAEQEKVDMRLYKVIYQAIEDIEAALTGMLKPVYEPRDTGRVIVRQIFKSSGVGTIAGCYVTDGVVERGSKARLYRGDKLLFDGDIASLRRFKDEVREVKLGFECGIVLEDFSDIEVDDTMEIYKMVEVPRG